MIGTIMQSLSCALVLVAVLACPTQAAKRNVEDMGSLNNLLQSLNSLSREIQSSKRTCPLGIHSHNCALSDLDRIMRARAFLSSGLSPGKRSSPGMLRAQDEGQDRGQGQDVDDILALQNDMLNQGKEISTIRQLLQGLRQADGEEQKITNKKRTCRLRLGGHCLTEELDRAASQYYFLSSPDSPGRRRRSTAGTVTSGHDVRTQESVGHKSESENKTLRR